MRTKERPRARAIERASDVLPTPGGPERQSICPFAVPAMRRMEINSNIRSLGFSMS